MKSGDDKIWEGDAGNASRFFKSIPQGRFPANLILEDCEEVRECFPETKKAGNTRDMVKNLEYNASSYKLSNNKNPAIVGDNGGNASRFFKSIPQGRFPTNLIHDNSEEVRECFPETGISKKGSNNGTKKSMFGMLNTDTGNMGFGDAGNASRYFKSIIYQAKASKSERNK